MRALLETIQHPTGHNIGGIAATVGLGGLAELLKLAGILEQGPEYAQQVWQRLGGLHPVFHNQCGTSFYGRCCVVPLMLIAMMGVRQIDRGETSV